LTLPCIFTKQSDRSQPGWLQASPYCRSNVAVIVSSFSFLSVNCPLK
jgi:hypothetical protein